MALLPLQQPTRLLRKAKAVMVAKAHQPHLHLSTALVLLQPRTTPRLFPLSLKAGRVVRARGRQAHLPQPNLKVKVKAARAREHRARRHQLSPRVKDRVVRVREHRARQRQLSLKVKVRVVRVRERPAHPHRLSPKVKARVKVKVVNPHQLPLNPKEVKANPKEVKVKVNLKVVKVNLKVVRANPKVARAKASLNKVAAVLSRRLSAFQIQPVSRASLKWKPSRLSPLPLCGPPLA